LAASMGRPPTWPSTRPLPQPAGLGRTRGLADGVENGGHGQAGGGQLGGVGLGQRAGHLAGDRVVARLDHGHRRRPAFGDRRRQADREQEGGVDLAPVDQGPGLAGVDLRTVIRSRRPGLASTPSVKPAATGPRSASATA
jgi:hypothetical protein